MERSFSWSLNKTNRDSVAGWRTDPVMMGGGALLEGGVHWINALVSLAGSIPREAMAIKPGVEYDSSVPFEDSLILVVKFADGAVGKLLHSWRIPNRFKGMGLSKVYGTEGVITFESNGLFCSLYGKKKKMSFFSPFEFLGFKAMHRAFIDNYVGRHALGAGAGKNTVGDDDCGVGLPFFKIRPI